MLINIIKNKKGCMKKNNQSKLRKAQLVETGPLSDEGTVRIVFVKTELMMLEIRILAKGK